MTTETERQGQSNVSITTEDLLGCLHSRHPSLTRQAAEVWLSLSYSGNRRGSPQLLTPSTCWLQMTGQGHGALSILILNGTCFTDNRLVVHSPTWNYLSYDCDPTAWVAPGVELTMMSNVANISIEINDVTTSFDLKVQFKMVPQRRRELLQIRHVTRRIGVFGFSCCLYFLCFLLYGVCY